MPKPPRSASRSATRTILLTGFEPFGGETINPSWEAARALDGARIANHRVVALQLPCVFGQAGRVLQMALREHRPKAVICTGQAGGRVGLTPERIAINVDDARIPDNAGAQPIDQPIASSGPAAYFTTLPNKAIVAALLARGIPADLSNSAGTFVCNHVAYALLQLLARSQQQPRPRGGFIHVPFLPEQVVDKPGAPALPLEAIIEGLAVACEVAVKAKADVRVVLGRLH